MASVPSPVSTSLRPDETVLRGGLLKHAVVLGGLRVVENRQFVVLNKSNKLLCQFLTGQAAFRRPLRLSSIVEELQSARDRKYQDLLGQRSAASAPEPPQTASVAASVDDLGLDEPISDKASVARQSRRLRASARKQVPRIAPVELHRPGRPVWICNVLMDNGRGAPAVEATTSNMQWLVDLVSSDITSGVSPRLAYGAPSGAKRRPRLLADGSREYFVRGSWIKKKKVAGKFRTMKRRPSDEEVPPRRRRVVRHAPAQLAVASDVDPLDMPL